MLSKHLPGQQDPEFGVGGVISAGLDERVGGHIRYLSDGSYLVIGRYVEDTGIGPHTQSTTSVITGVSSGAEYYRKRSKNRIVTVKLDKDGRLDCTYGTNGYAFLPPFEYEVRLTASVLLPDSSVVMSLGLFDVDGGGFDSLVVVKVNADGKMDKNFGDHGVHRPSLPYEHSIAGAMAVQDDGKILIAAQTVNVFNDTNSVLLRIDAEGKPDLSFGKQGYVYSRHGTKGAFVNIKLDQQRRIYVAGRIGEKMAVFRFLEDGTPDKAFGEAGEFAYRLRDQFAFLSALNIQGNAIYACGASGDLGDQAAAYIKLTMDGALDESFHGGVPLEIKLRSGNSGDFIVHQESGQVIGVGTSFLTDGALTLSRINKDGTLDTAQR